LVKQELINRVLTSLAVFPILVYCTYISGNYLIVLLLGIYSISFYEIIKNTKSVFFNFTSNLVLILAFFSFYSLRGSTNESLIILYWILVSTFLSDIGGYVFGKTFKGKKLTKISPNKTYSGSLGSVILSLLSIPLISFAQQFFFVEELINFSQFKFYILAVIISFICQLGDLYVSFLKRRLKIKNTGNFFPGHGGVLDRIDGLIFVLIFNFLLKKIGLI
jgi:phosphatidate cytidylyltransferase